MFCNNPKCLKILSITSRSSIKLTWNRNGLGYLTESLRIEEGDLRTLSFEALDEILEGIRSRSVRVYIKGLKGAVSHGG